MDTTETNILTTSLSLKTIGFGLFGTIFFGAFAYMALPAREIIVEGVSYVTGMIYISPQKNRAVKNKYYFYSYYGKEETYHIKN